MALMDAPDVSGTQFGQLHVADRLDDVADGPFDVARCTATVSHGVLGEVALRPSRDDGRIARCLAAGDLAHCRPGSSSWHTSAPPAAHIPTDAGPPRDPGCRPRHGPASVPGRP